VPAVRPLKKVILFMARRVEITIYLEVRNKIVSVSRVQRRVSATWFVISKPVFTGRPLRETKLASTKLAATFVETFVETLPYGKQNLLPQNLHHLLWKLLLNPSFNVNKI